MTIQKQLLMLLALALAMPSVMQAFGVRNNSESMLGVAFSDGSKIVLPEGAFDSYKLAKGGTLFVDPSVLRLVGSSRQATKITNILIEKESAGKTSELALPKPSYKITDLTPDDIFEIGPDFKVRLASAKTESSSSSSSSSSSMPSAPGGPKSVEERLGKLEAEMREVKTKVDKFFGA